MIECNVINSNTQLKCIQTDVPGSSEGGYLKKFYDFGILRKAVLISYGETGKLTIEYYFQNGRLLFIYEKEDHYQLPIYEKEGGKIKQMNENRYYFNAGKLIRWIGNKNNIIKKELYSSKEAQIKEDLKIYSLQ